MKTCFAMATPAAGIAPNPKNKPRTTWGCYRGNWRCGILLLFQYTNMYLNVNIRLLFRWMELMKQDIPDVLNLSWSNWGVQLTEVEELSLTGGQGRPAPRDTTINGQKSVLLPVLVVKPKPEPKPEPKPGSFALVDPNIFFDPSKTIVDPNKTITLPGE
ncbi:MAG: hypothetical protein ICV54_10970 [Nostoc sp. C3-bin3]|nr:hypothetical protein [Nostoc sp. C3-bin3]